MLGRPSALVYRSKLCNVGDVASSRTSTTFNYYTRQPLLRGPWECAIDFSLKLLVRGPKSATLGIAEASFCRSAFCRIHLLSSASPEACCCSCCVGCCSPLASSLSAVHLARTTAWHDRRACLQDAFAVPPFGLRFSSAWPARQRRSRPPRSGGLWCGLLVLFEA